MNKSVVSGCGIPLSYSPAFDQNHSSLMLGSREFCQRGPTYNVFVFLEGREDPNTYHFKRAIIDPPEKRHLNGVSLVRRNWPKIEFWLSSFVIFQAIPTSVAKKPFSFVIFHGGPDPPPPPGSTHEENTGNQTFS